MFLRFNFHFFQTTWSLKSIFVTLFMFIVAGAVLISYVENLSFGHSLYFALVTGLTIGYGDITPATTIGRVISIMLGFIGIVITGLVVAVAVRSLQQAVEEVTEK